MVLKRTNDRIDGAFAGQNRFLLFKSSDAFYVKRHLQCKSKRQFERTKEKCLAVSGLFGLVDWTKHSNHSFRRGGVTALQLEK